LVTLPFFNELTVKTLSLPNFKIPPLIKLERCSCSTKGRESLVIEEEAEGAGVAETEGAEAK